VRERTAAAGPAPADPVAAGVAIVLHQPQADTVAGAEHGQPARELICQPPLAPGHRGRTVDDHLRGGVVLGLRERDLQPTVAPRRGQVDPSWVVTRDVLADVGELDRRAEPAGAVAADEAPADTVPRHELVASQLRGEFGR